MELRRLMFISVSLLCVVGALAVSAQRSDSSDWPQWRGTNRDGISRETGLLTRWPEDGPRSVWTARDLGEGFSSIAVSGGRIFGMGYRDGQEAVWALKESDGSGLWLTPVGKPLNPDPGGRGPGPRGTPTVDGDRVYTLGVNGQLACLNAANGRLIWRRDLMADYGGRVPSWGYCESPLIDGNKVIATPGGRSATIVALDKMSGKEIWRTRTPGRDPAHYSSCIAADVDGQRQYIQFLRSGVVGVAASDGRFLWSYARPANGTANCATPIYRDNHIFAASAYGTGGGCARLTTDQYGKVSVTELYFTRRMQNHHGGLVLAGDFIYGFDGSNLTCLNFKTGQEMWHDRSVGKGSVIFADGYIYARSERGPVALIEATPAGYVEKGRFAQPERSRYSTWAYPVIAGGRLYLRDQGNLFSYALK